MGIISINMSNMTIQKFKMNEWGQKNRQKCHAVTRLRFWGSTKSKRSRVCSVAHPLLIRDIILFAGFWWQMFPPVTPPAQKTTNFNWFLVKISLFLLFYVMFKIVFIPPSPKPVVEICSLPWVKMSQEG